MRRAIAFPASLALGLTLLFNPLHAPTARAQTWDGGGPDNNWTTDLNWIGDVAPVNNGTADTIFAGLTRLTPNVDVAYNINSLTFDNTAGAFITGGMPLTIQGGGITNDSTNLQSFNNSIVLGTAQTWNANTGNLLFASGVNNGGNLLTVTGASNTTITGAISGAGGLTKDGAGTLILNGANTFGGTVTVLDGVLQAGNSGTLSNVAYVINGGTLDLNNFAATMSSLSGAGGTVDLGSAFLTVNQAGNTTYAGVITGTGGLIKTGAGTLTLSGANDFTGAVTVSGGVLQQGAAGALPDVAYTINMGGTLDLNDFNLTMSALTGAAGGIIDLGTATLTVDQATNTTYGGIITGTGNLVKDGDGTLILTGANNYTGTTTVNDGTLQGDTTSLTTDITVNAGANVTFNQAADGTYADDIDGNGTFTKAGVGVLTVTGTNTHTGGTIVSGGTLRSGAANALPDGTPYTINATGTLDLNGNDLTMSAITGAGNVTLGTAELTVNTATTDSTFDGVISGAGSLVKDGGETLILNGANTYSGGTTVSAGILQGTTTSLQGDITNDATLQFEQSTDGTYGDVISGTGELIKRGSGTVNFSDANTYTGTTSIFGGRLNINGSIVSDTTVNTNGTLGGTGTITADVTNQGTVAAGSSPNSVGALAINGNFTNSANGTVRVNIQPDGDNNVLNVTGNATLNGGTVNVNAAAGNYNAGQTFTFLNAGARIGEFDDVIDNLPGNLDPVLGYTNGSAFFTLLRNGKTYEAVGRTQNQRAVGAYLDVISPTATGDLQTVLNGINAINDNEARLAFNQLSGDVHGSLGQVGLQNTTLILAQLAQRLRGVRAAPGGMTMASAASGKTGDGTPVSLVNYSPDGAAAFGEGDCWNGYGCNDCGPDCGPDCGLGCGHCGHCCECCCGWSPWVQGYGLGGSAQSDGNATGLDYGMGGVMFGADRWADDCHLYGFYGGYVGTSVQCEGNQFINGGYFGGYLHSTDCFHYSTLLGGFQFDGYDTERPLQFDDINRVASASYTGWQGYAYFERGVSFQSCDRVFQPFLGLQYVHLRQNGFTETGANSINLTTGGLETDSLRGLLGGRWQWAWVERTGRRTMPEFHALWLHEFLDTNTILNARFAPIGGTTFASQGLDLGRDWALIGVAVNWELHDCWQLSVNYDCQTNAQQTFHVGSGGLSHMW